MAYPNYFKHTGKAIVLVNGLFDCPKNDREDGAESDRKSMNKLLKENLKFDIVPLNDLPGDSIVPEIEKGKKTV